MSFNDDELPSKGKEHKKSLHISMDCARDVLARVLIDIGSSLNVMPKSILAKLSYEGTVMRPSVLVVKAFNGSMRIIIGEVDLPIQIGPHIFEIPFQVININPTYKCLLGRSWIRAAGIKPSILHQKLKFVINNKLVIMFGE